jgi:hypothetical protein
VDLSLHKTGNMAGSLGLNKRFNEEVQRIIGPKDYARVFETAGYAQAMNQFDKMIKPAFRDDPKEEYYVSFPLTDLTDKKKYNLKKDMWAMTS